MARYGVFLPSFEASVPVTGDLLREVATTAEDRGLAHLWVGDHFVWNVGMVAPMQVLTHVAAVTSRIQLGTGVYLLPLRHPSIVAKDVASLDVLSDGRLLFGVGIGGENPVEYEALGVEMNRRGARLEEGLVQLRSLLRQEQAAQDGEFHSIPAVELAPAPRQDAVPVWIGGRAQAVVERAADMGDGWFPVWVSPRRYAGAVDVIRERRGGTEGFAFGLNIFSAIAESREAAGKILSDHMGSAYGLPFEKFERYAAFGTADDVAETLAAYRDAGVTDFAMNLAGNDPVGQLEELAAVARDLEGGF